MKIPTGVGAVVLHTTTGRYAVRTLVETAWWTFGSYLWSDSTMQERVDLTPNEWEVLSEGVVAPPEEPLKHGSAVYVDNQVFLRWTENQSERFSWIGAKDGVKLSWKDLLGMGKVEPYEL